MSGAARERGAWPVLVATSVNVVLVFVGATSLTILLPQVSREFGASPAETTWFILAYQLVMTALIIVFGRLSDIFGRKRIYVVGVLVFLVGSLAAGLVQGAGAFVVARLVQGVGAAAIITNTTAILTDVFPRERLPAALGMNATSAAFGQALGPVVGGLASELADWRVIFLVSGPVALLSLLVSLRLVPGRPGTGRERVDVVGSLTLVSSLSLFVAGMSAGSAAGWSGPTAPLLVGGALVLLAVFVGTQTRVASPLVDLSLFRVPRLGRRYAAVFVSGFSQYAVILLLSTHLQATQGASAFEVATMVVVAPLSTIVAAQVAGRLVGRVPVARLAVAGMVMIVVAAASLAVAVRTDTVAVGAYVSLALLGLGIGTFMTPNTSLIMLITPTNRRGVSNGIRSTLLNAGFLVTTAVALAVSTAPLSADARRAVYAGDFPLPGAEADHFAVGVQLALLVLVVSGVVGAVLSGGRGAAPSAAGQPVPSDAPRPTAGGPDGAPVHP
ncbi:MFS transporter [Cellulosimicrobium cellulans]|uniref:MFS transporter n=1 Tax=Cellulosimicrobium cellulans TaxID=1710 RepID=UPI0008491854|nr:MFS transporter [Cellulosimicrobium cellulans]